MKENTELYSYNNKEKPIFSLREVKQNNPIEGASYSKIILTYNSPYKTGIDRNDLVYCEIFLPLDYQLNFESLTNKPDNKPLDFKLFSLQDKKITSLPFLILVHGFMSDLNRLDNYYYFIDRMLEKNIACAFINLPFHLHRRPYNEKSGHRLIYYDDSETLEFFHQSVVDIRRLIDIICHIFPIKNINICGISLGSMVSLIVTAQDKRINKAILLIGGGNWKEIHWNGLLRFVLKGNCVPEDHITKNKCKEFYSKFHDFVKEFKKISPDILTPNMNNYPSLNKLLPRKCFLCDPLLFAYRIDPKKVLMINSKFDFYFSKKSTKELWKELGEPEICWLNYFHSTKILIRPKVLQKVVKAILETAAQEV